MESWVHGAAAIYHPYDERNVDIDAYGPATIRPGIPANSYPKVVDLVFDFQWPLVNGEAPASGWALDEVLVRIRTYSRPDDEQETGIMWVLANDREYRKVAVFRDEPLTSPDRFRVLRFPAPRPSTPYSFDPSYVSGAMSVGLRVEGPGLALISAVGLRLRPAIRWRFGNFDYRPDAPGRMDEDIMVDPEMTMADFREAIADPFSDPQPREHPRGDLRQLIAEEEDG